MITEIVRLTDDRIEEKLQIAAEIIKSGGLVVFPTETVYGLGGNATDPNAAEAIYAAKGRPTDNPLIIHIADPSNAEEYAYTSVNYYRIADAFMPGPITVVLKAKESVPMTTRGGLDTVAVRCPSDKIANKLIRLAGVPIAAPSANISGSPSPTIARHVIKDMDGKVDMIIDGGDCDFGLESTIVKLESKGKLTLLRPGRITISDLEAIGFEVSVAEAVVGKLKEGEKPLSPGMKYRHYAPKAPVFLFDGTCEQLVEHVKEHNDKKIGIIWYREELSLISDRLDNIELFDIGSRYDLKEQAHCLFGVLRNADEKSFDEIFAPLPPKEGIGLALYNRMIRAAAHQIIRM